MKTSIQEALSKRGIQSFTKKVPYWMYASDSEIDILGPDGVHWVNQFDTDEELYLTFWQLVMHSEGHI